MESEGEKEREREREREREKERERERERERGEIERERGGRNGKKGERERTLENENCAIVTSDMRAGEGLSITRPGGGYYPSLSWLPDELETRGVTCETCRVGRLTEELFLVKTSLTWVNILRVK